MRRDVGGEAAVEWESGGESALCLLEWLTSELNDWIQDMVVED